MVWTFLQVAIGGAVGAVLRYASVLFATRSFGGSFPIGTLSVNVIGSLIMGFLVIFLTQKNLMNLSPLLLIGVLGGFTTFSAFSLDSYNLFSAGEISGAIYYLFLSIFLSIVALLLGIYLARYLVG
ncbi:MAG: fluoride efflux transporter CrcB [Proteobacteria bacterium]|jgi:CrcB protein|nr:fluoride efflux transporter CrcB [Pseudomonadota bacterium]MDA1239065.1 fluoride efflux transporter CrcB [Pseudomonadota bacterium]